MKRYAIIVAGGKGLRMGNELPKQFMEINRLPILMHTLKAFYDFDTAIHIILVLPEFHFEFWKELCTKCSFKIPHEIVMGGIERFHSVMNGLKVINDENSIVAIHDGVRPFVSKETLSLCFEGAEKYGSAIPVINAIDSIRIIEKESNKAIDRSVVKLVQTPQTFITKNIKLAFNQEYRSFFTDDASVYEALGEKINLVEGNEENIKITSPKDLIFAQYFCDSENISVI